MKSTKILLSLVLLLGVTGCASTSYVNPDEMTTISTDFGASDLQQIASSMVDSLINFPPIVDVTSKRRPVVVVDMIRNKTRQHIDTEAITDSIRSQLVKAGKFRFIDRASDASSIREVRWQQESGLVNQATAVKFGKQYGAEYILVGSISEIMNRSGRDKEVLYQFTLSLKNLTTGILEWSDDKKIKKMGKRAIFGW